MRCSPRSPPERRACRAARAASNTRSEPEPEPAAFAVANMEKPPQTYILKLGDYKHKLGDDRRGFPSIWARITASSRRPHRAGGPHWRSGSPLPITL